jgi:hypothetical protein
MISIRAATERDAVAIAHVHVQSWRTTYAGIVPEEYLATLNEAERVLLWRDWLTRDLRVYIADLDGEIVGFISGEAIREPVQTYDAELFRAGATTGGRKSSSPRACRIAVGRRLHRHDRLGTREESFATLLCEIERARSSQPRTSKSGG